MDTKENSNQKKTKKMQKTLDNLKVGKALMIVPEKEETLIYSARNIQGIKLASPFTINVYDILKYGTVVADKAVISTIEEVYA